MDKGPSLTGPDIAVIDYGMGNLRSVTKAWEHAGGRVRVVRQPEDVRSPDALVLPGVGALADCTAALERTGLAKVVREWIERDRPFFGICLGLQALFETSEEGAAQGLGVFAGCVRRFQVPPPLKVPHMGWNVVAFEGGEALLHGLQPRAEQFYFVHSYHIVPQDEKLVWGRTEYGNVFVSAIRRGRCIATQFHPEKSQAKGLQIYRNFIQSL